MKTWIMIAGLLSVLLALIHIPAIWQNIFPDWKEDFQRMSLPNRKLVNTLLVALTISLWIFSFISLFYASELSQGQGLAAGMTIALSVFWLWRSIWQLLYFQPSKLDPHRTYRKLLIFHYTLIVIFVGLFIVYLVPVISRRG